MKRALVLVAAAWLLIGAAAEACDVPPGGAPRTRLEEAGIVVVFRALPPAIEVGSLFTLEIFVCADGTAPVLARVDAQMPEHRHGMNYRPTLAAKGGGRYVAEGFLFHMPGLWRLLFDVEQGGRRTRLVTDVRLE